MCAQAVSNNTSQPVQPVQPAEELTSIAALQALMAHGGQIKVAAEVLGVTPEQILTVLSQDAAASDQLNAYLRVQNTIRVVETLDILQMALKQNSANLNPDAAVRVFASMLTNQNKQGDSAFDPAGGVDAGGVILRLLPVDVRAAVLALIDQGPPKPQADAS